MSEEVTVDGLNDDPLAGDETEADHLGRREFANSAASILTAVAASESSSVVALVGDWGSGKTSVLNMIKTALGDSATDGSDGWIITDFNPWFFQDLETLQTGYFRELSAAIPSKGDRTDAVRKSLANFGGAIAPFASFAALFGVPDASKTLHAFSDLISPDQSLTKTRAKLEEALRDLGRPVLMVLDDLDRLAPDELLLTLKLIRLVGRLPHVHYLVAYDEDTLLDSLSRTGLVGKEARRGLEYLEKMIQVRLDLPPVRQGQLDQWIDRELASLRGRLRVEFDDEERRRLTHVFMGHLRDRLATPRALKRYFAQVRAFLDPIHTELDIVDFLVLTWLRTAEPLVYDMLAEERSALLGEVRSLDMSRLLRGSDSKERAHRYWTDRLERARVSPLHLEGVADMIGQLFPRFRAHWQKVDPEHSRRDATPKRVHHPHYFDRYFAFGVPPEDISDADAATAYSQIREGHDGRELATVEDKIAADASNLNVVLSKMLNAFKAEQSGGVDLLGWIAKQRRQLPDDSDGILTAEMQSRWVAQEIYLLLPAEEPSAAVDVLAQKEGGLSLASYLIAEARREAERHPSWDRWSAFERAEHRFIDAVRATLGRHDDEDVFNVPDDVWSLIWDWQRLDLDGARAWLRERIDSGGWSLLDVVARFVSRQRVMGVPGAPWTLGELHPPILDRLFGIEKLLDDLRDLLPSPSIEEHDRRRLEATPENRRAVALSELSRLDRDRDEPAERSGG